jgi:hypothetical protein
MAIFIVRNSVPFTQYVRRAWSYFTPNNKEGVKIIIRKGNTFVHINRYYCVICNDLLHLENNNRLEANKKSLKWLQGYKEFFNVNSKKERI